MENFMYAANGVIPVFLVVIIGSFLKYKKVFSEEFYSGLSRFVFLVATPSLLFSDTAAVDFYATFDVKFLCYELGMLLIFVIVLWLTVPLFVKDRRKAGAVIHCSYRSNFAILGLPLIKNVLGTAGAAKAAVVLAFGVPLFNVVAVVCLSYWSETEGDYKKVLKNIITNPLIIGALGGLFFSLFKIQLPYIVTRTIQYVGNTAIGLGLIVLGASFELKDFIKSIKSNIITTMMKIVVAPIFALIPACLLGYRNDELVITLVYFGSSTAINSYVMAREMKSDDKLTAGVLVCSTGLSVFTLFLGLYLLKSFGLVG